MDNIPSGMSEMLAKLMADEKFGEMVESLKSSFSADAESAHVEEFSTAVAEGSADIENSESPVSAIPKLSPELMSKLPEIMGMLSSSEGGKKHTSRMDDRKRLLNAMKPFLSEKRRSAVDSIVNIAGIADLFGI